VLDPGYGRAVQAVLIEKTAHPHGFKLTGDLDASNVRSFREAIEPELQVGGDLTIDLRGLAFMDSSGIGALVDAARRLEGRGSLILLPGELNPSLLAIMAELALPNLQLGDRVGPPPAGAAPTGWPRFWPAGSGYHPGRSWVRAERLSESQRRERSRPMAVGVLAALSGGTATILWIVAAVLVIAGIVYLVRGSVAAGIVLIIVGLLIGPGGYSIFR
jgi:anti-anti-sigma factor